MHVVIFDDKIQLTQFNTFVLTSYRSSFTLDLNARNATRT